MKQLIALAVGACALFGAASEALAGGSIKDSYAAPAAHCASGPFAGAYIAGTVGVAHSDYNHTVGPGGATGDYTSYTDRISLNEDRNFVGGLGAGYNWQCDRFVFGLVGDINFGEISATADYGGGDRIKASMDHFATLRAKFGIAHENILLYVTGGIALTSHDYELSGCCTAKTSIRDEAFVWGGGIEMNRGRWSLTAELLHMDFGKTTIDYVLTSGGCPATTCGFGTTWDNSVTVARIGLNLKLHHHEEDHHHPMK